MAGCGEDEIAQADTPNNNRNHNRFIVEEDETIPRFLSMSGLGFGE